MDVGIPVTPEVSLCGKTIDFIPAINDTAIFWCLVFVNATVSGAGVCNLRLWRMVGDSPQMLV